MAQRNGYDVHVDVNPALVTPTLYRHPIFYGQSTAWSWPLIRVQKSCGFQGSGLKNVQGCQNSLLEVLETCNVLDFSFLFLFFHLGEEPHF